MLCEAGVTFDIFSRQRLFSSDSVDETDSIQIKTKTYDGPDVAHLYLNQIIYYTKNQKNQEYILYHLLHPHIKNKYKKECSQLIESMIESIHSKGEYRSLYKKLILQSDALPLLNHIQKILSDDYSLDA